MMYAAIRTPVVVGVVAVAVTVGACGSSAKPKTATPTTTAAAPTTTVAASSTTAAASSTTATSAPASAAQITIQNFAFHPTPLQAKVRQTVTVTNSDTTTHTFTANDKSFDTGNLAPQTSKQVTVGKAGTLSYHCSIHPFMTGVIQAS
jgi:plastocyanin